jgi:hypothetical protein
MIPKLIGTTKMDGTEGKCKFNKFWECCFGSGKKIISINEPFN